MVALVGLRITGKNVSALVILMLTGELSFE